MPYLGAQGPAANQQSAAQTAQVYTIPGTTGPAFWDSPKLNIYGRPNVSLALLNYSVDGGARRLIDAFYTRVQVYVFSAGGGYYAYDEYICVGPAELTLTPYYGTGQSTLVWREQLVLPCTEIRVRVRPYTGVDIVDTQLYISATA